MRWTNPLQWGGNWFPGEQFCGKGPGGCGGQQAEELPALCSGSKEGCSVFLGCIIRTGSRSKGVIFLFIWHSLDHIWTIATSFEHFGTRKESQLEQFQWRAIRMAPPTGMIPCSNFVIQVNFVLWYFFKTFLCIFQNLFLGKYFDKINLLNRKMGLYCTGKYLKGKKKKEHCNQTSCRLPILKYVIESNTTQKE